MFNGSVAVLLAFLSSHLLTMTNTEIGFVLSAYQMTSALSQPLCGWLADRNGGRWLGAGGVAWTVSLLMLSLVLAASTHSYVLMLIPMVLAALGSGAFHPVGTMHAAETDHLRMTGNLSVFFFMGQMGGGLGPAIVGFLLDETATHNTLFTTALGPAMTGRLAEHGSVAPILFFALFAIPGVLLMALTIPGARVHRARPAAPSEHRQVALSSLLLLGVIVTLRGLINPGLVSFLPRLFEVRGWSAAEYGLLTTMYWVGGGIMGVTFGQLADRYGSRLLIVISLLLAAPAVFALSLSDGAITYVLALLVGGFSGGSHSLIVAMAQKLMPAGKGLASGASLGFIFGMGALGVLAIGTTADHLGLAAAFQIVAVLGVVTGLLALLLPADRPQKQAESTPVEEAIPA